MRGCRSSGAGASHREPVVTAGRTGLLDQEADAFGKVALASSLQEGQVGNGEQDGLADRWFGVGARAAGAGSPAAVTSCCHGESAFLRAVARSILIVANSIKCFLRMLRVHLCAGGWSLLGLRDPPTRRQQPWERRDHVLA